MRGRLRQNLREGNLRVPRVLLLCLAFRLLPKYHPSMAYQRRAYMHRTPSVAIFRSTRSSGVPMIRMMWRSWSWLSRPRNRGTPEIISANMHPHDHTSMEVLYVREPIRTSGARYHSVTT